MVDLCLPKAYNGTTELASSALQLSGRAALEATKQKRTAQQSTVHSQIIIGEGQGRATRECKLIWCPTFDTSTNAILTVRVYVARLHLQAFQKQIKRSNGAVHCSVHRNQIM